MEPDPADNSPGAMLAHLWHTRRTLETILYDLLPARGESLERLESIASSHSGVESAYAIQAGREIRVIVNAEKVNDKTASKICRDIANEIQEELNYPGEVRVTVIRETRCVEYAR